MKQFPPLNSSHAKKCTIRDPLSYLVYPGAVTTKQIFLTSRQQSSFKKAGFKLLESNLRPLDYKATLLTIWPLLFFNKLRVIMGLFDICFYVFRDSSQDSNWLDRITNRFIAWYRSKKMSFNGKLLRFRWQEWFSTMKFF